MRKKRVSLLAVSVAVIVCAGICITGITAFFIATSSAENIVGIGNDEVTIEETFRNPDIQPNAETTITKKVSVANTGENYAAVRVRAEFSKDDVLSYTTVDYNTVDWEFDGGYWYYKVPVAPGEKTSELFNELFLDSPTPEQVADFDVYVYAESRNCEDDATASDIRGLFS